MLRCLAALCLIFCLGCPISASFAQDEEPIFSSDEALTTARSPNDTLSPTHLATAYWKIAALMTLTAAAPGAHVQMLLPLSDGRQSVLSRHTGAEGINYREEADGLNLWGHWQVTGANEAQRQIRYEYTVQIADARTELPTISFPSKVTAPEIRPYLLPSTLIQSDAAQVRARARRLVQGSKRIDQAAW